MVRITKGLHLPIGGRPEQKIYEISSPSHVALIGDDYVGMRPTMLVKVGDTVKKGQVLFTDKKTAGVCYTAPTAGKVTEVNRGAKRAFQSMVIQCSGSDSVEFESHQETAIAALAREKVVKQLVDSGSWPALRTRPFSKVPAIDSTPSSIFVTAIDTHPLAARPQVVINEAQTEFRAGMRVIRKLTEGKVFLVKESGDSLSTDVPNVQMEEFSGPHPAGLPGTHIHFLDPVHSAKTVWHINYQDVINFGRLFLTGRPSFERVISLAGPGVLKPRLIKVNGGHSIEDICRDELRPGSFRKIAGSIFGGRTAEGAYQFLGRYHNQIVLLPVETERKFLGWLSLGPKVHSLTNVFLGKFVNARGMSFTTATHGSPRAMVPIGNYEKVMPLDMEPTFLLRSLICEDTEQAQALGALELDEEDLALLTYACPSKYEYGPILRNVLTAIEKDG